MDTVPVTLATMPTDTAAPPEPAVDAPQDRSTEPSARRRFGVALVVLGICGILWGVFHILGAVGSPSDGNFANRLPYNEVKRSVHGSFPGGLLRGFGGLAVAMIGNALVKQPK